MRFKKFTAFTLCLTIFTCSLGSCGDSDEKSSPKEKTTNSKEEISQNTSESTENSNFEKNENSDAELNCNSISFEGKSIELPCLVEELGDIYPDEASLFTSFGYTTGHLMYGNAIVGNIFIDEADFDKEIGKRTVVGLDFSSFDSTVNVNYMGVSMNDTRDKMIEVLGEPDSQKSDTSYSKYMLDENNENHYVEFDFYDVNKDLITEIALYVK